MLVKYKYSVFFVKNKEGNKAQDVVCENKIAPNILCLLLTFI